MKTLRLNRCEMLALRNAVAKVKNGSDGPVSNLKIAERISELQGSSVDT